MSRFPLSQPPQSPQSHFANYLESALNRSSPSPPPLPPASYTRHVQTRRRRSRTAYLSAILFRQAGIICATSVTFPPSSKKSFPSPFPFIGHSQIITVSAQSSPGKKLGRDGKLLLENTFIHPFAQGAKIPFFDSIRSSKMFLLPRGGRGEER